VTASDVQQSFNLITTLVLKLALELKPTHDFLFSGKHIEASICYFYNILDLEMFKIAEMTFKGH